MVLNEAVELSVYRKCLDFTIIGFLKDFSQNKYSCGLNLYFNFLRARGFTFFHVNSGFNRKK